MVYELQNPKKRSYTTPIEDLLLPIYTWLYIKKPRIIHAWEMYK